LTEEILKLKELLKTEHGRELIKESIAEVFHDAWMNWSQSICVDCTIPLDRLKRWNTFWTTPYCQIPNSDKEPEFAHAEKIMRRLGLID